MFSAKLNNILLLNYWRQVLVIRQLSGHHYIKLNRLYVVKINSCLMEYHKCYIDIKNLSKTLSYIAVA